MLKDTDIIIYVEGGLVQEVAGNDLVGRRIFIVDGDTETDDEEQLTNGFWISEADPYPFSKLDGEIVRAVKRWDEELEELEDNAL